MFHVILVDGRMSMTRLRVMMLARGLYCMVKGRCGAWFEVRVVGDKANKRSID